MDLTIKAARGDYRAIPNLKLIESVNVHACVTHFVPILCISVAFPFVNLIRHDPIQTIAKRIAGKYQCNIVQHSVSCRTSLWA